MTNSENPNIRQLPQIEQHSYASMLFPPGGQHGNARILLRHEIRAAFTTTRVDLAVPQFWREFLMGIVLESNALPATVSSTLLESQGGDGEWHPRRRYLWHALDRLAHLVQLEARG